MGVPERTQLEFICQRVMNDPDLQPNGGLTYCNKSVHRICTYFGYQEFHGLLANGIIDHMEQESEWNRILPDAAHAAAEQGRVVVAGTKGDIHGHVAVVYPGPMIFSGKWNCEMPQVANVGKSVGVMGAGHAFRNVPTFYILDNSKMVNS